MVSAYMLFSFVLGNLIGGYIQDRTNPRLVATIGCILFCGGVFLSSLLTKSTVTLFYLTYCVMGGLGSGFAYGSVLSCVQKWFPHRRGFASGLSISAFALSTVVVSPLSRWLMGLAVFGERGVPLTFHTLSIAFFIASMTACRFIRLPSAEFLQTLKLPEEHSYTSARNLTPSEAMRTIPFWCLVFSCFFINGAWNITVPLIKDLGIERGLSEVWAVLTVSLTGITNAAGRLIVATVSDKIGRTAAIVLMAAITCAGMLLLIAVDGPLYIIVILFIAFAYGGPAGTFPAMTTDLGGFKYSGTNYGIVLLALGISSIVFNSLSNLLLSATGGYTASFIMAGTCALIPIILMLPIRRYNQRSKTISNSCPQ